MKRKVTLYLKNGQQHQITCLDDNDYLQLLESINKDQFINIIGDNKTITIKGGNIDYHESEILNKPERRNNNLPQ